jgi:hypothetical protein
LNEKQAIEKATADAFITLYNSEMETSFSTVEYSDAPDVRCKDPDGNILNFEITLTEDRPKDIQALLGRSDHRNVESLKKHLADVKTGKANPLQRTSCLQGNVTEMIVDRILSKWKKHYGPHTALVIRDTSPVEWDWEVVIKQIKTSLENRLKKEKLARTPFDRGIWILANTKDRIFRIPDPEFEAPQSSDTCEEPSAQNLKVSLRGRVVPSRDEKGWSNEQLQPLLRQLGFRRVDFVHGPLEAGRDIVMADYDRFGLLKYYAVQVKDGDLRAQSATQEINTIVDQVRTAFQTPYRDPLTGTEQKIAGVYLVVNGSITEPARNILYSKTGGWFNIIDLSQLDLAPLLARGISDDERRWILVAVRGEIVSNQLMLDQFVSQLRQLETNRPIKLPACLIRTRALERHIEIAYQELCPHDLAWLDTVVMTSNTFNFVVGKLPLGPFDAESARSAIDLARTACSSYLEKSSRLDQGLLKILKMERPAPGQRFEEPFFWENDNKEKNSVPDQ